jgi:hypothetical protein
VQVADGAHRSGERDSDRHPADAGGHAAGPGAAADGRAGRPKPPSTRWPRAWPPPSVRCCGWAARATPAPPCSA